MNHASTAAYCRRLSRQSPLCSTCMHAGASRARARAPAPAHARKELVRNGNCRDSLRQCSAVADRPVVFNRSQNTCPGGVQNHEIRLRRPLPAEGLCRDRAAICVDHRYFRRPSFTICHAEQLPLETDLRRPVRICQGRHLAHHDRPCCVGRSGSPNRRQLTTERPKRRARSLCRPRSAPTLTSKGRRHEDRAPSSH